MQRVKRLYLRFKGAQLPVYAIETDTDSEEFARLLDEKKAKVVAEYTQYGFRADVTHEIIEVPEGRFVLQSVTPGGALKRHRDAKKGKSK